MRLRSFIANLLMVMMTVGAVGMAVRQFFGGCRAHIQDISFKVQLLPRHGMVKVDNHRVFGNRYHLALETITIIILQWHNAAYFGNIGTVKHFLWQVSNGLLIVIAVSILGR